MNSDKMSDFTDEEPNGSTNCNTEISGDIKFLAYISKVSFFLNGIKSMNFTSQTEIEISRKGVKLCAEESKFFQGALLLDRNFFEFYHYNVEEEKIVFGINIKIFTDLASNLVGDDELSLTLIYYGDHKPLSFTFVDKSFCEDITKDQMFLSATNVDQKLPGMIITEFQAKIKHRINAVNFYQLLRNREVLSTVIVKTWGLEKLIMDYDKDVEKLKLIVRKERFIFQTEGMLELKQKTVLTTGKTKSLMRLEMESANKASDFSYKYCCFKAMRKAFKFTRLASFRTYSDGVLKIQLRPSIDEILPLRLEFVIVPCTDDD